MQYQEYQLDAKALSADSLLLHSLLTGLLGALLLLRPHLMSNLFRWSAFWLFLLSGAAGLLAFFFGRKQEVRNIRQLLMAFISLYLAWFAYRHPAQMSALLPLAMGANALLSGFLHFVTCYLQRKNNEWVGLNTFFMGLLSALLGMLLVIWPVAMIDTALVLSGLYCLMSAATQFTDYLEERRPGSKPGRVWRRDRVDAPPALFALVPKRAQEKINRIWDRLSEDASEADEDGGESAPDFEIFIHATEKGLGTVGHVDICFEDVVRTYGPYDFDSHRWGGLICNGVLAVISGRDRYLNFCTNYSKKTIFCYGLRLTGEQKEQVRKKIDQLMLQVRVWHSPYRRDPTKPHTDYASVLQRELDAQLYQFVKGEFQTYFMGSTNCAMLADRIIGSLGTDILSPGGLVTPGAYYSYLEREYRKKSGLVVSKRVCRAA